MSKVRLQKRWTESVQSHDPYWWFHFPLLEGDHFTVLKWPECRYETEVIIKPLSLAHDFRLGPIDAQRGRWPGWYILDEVIRDRQTLYNVFHHPEETAAYFRRLMEWSQARYVSHVWEFNHPGFNRDGDGRWCFFLFDCVLPWGRVPVLQLVFTSDKLLFKVPTNQLTLPHTFQTLDVYECPLSTFH